jgi:uncharacterized protein involved in exopolysaccharide biosynthesis
MMNEALGQPRETTLRDFVAVVFRRGGVILIVLLAALGTLFVMNTRTLPEYMSSARMLVSRGEPESVFNSRTVILPWDEELNSELEVVKSATLGESAQKILKESNAVDSNGSPIKFDYGKVTANTSGRASVILVSYLANDALEARESLRALLRAYTEWRTRARSLPVVDSFFQEEMESLRDQLSQWEERRAAFMTDEGISNLTTEREGLLRQKDASSTELSTLRAKLADFSTRLEVVRNLQEEKKTDPNIDVFGINDGEGNDDELLITLRRELIARRADYYQKKSRLKDDHPDVLAAKDVVTNLEGQLDMQLDNYTRYLDSRIAVVRARINSLEATIRGIDDELSGMPDKEARLTQYDRIIDALKTDYNTVVERQVTAKIEQSGRSEWSVVVLQPASKAIRQRTRDYVRMALVPGFALLFGLAMAFIIDGLDHSLKDPSEVETHLKLPVLGSLSRIR